MSTCDIGLIGLAVMGENLVLNMESKGFNVAVFNRTVKVVEDFAAARGKGKNFGVENPDFAKKNFEAGWSAIIGTELKNFVEGKQ